MFQQASATFHNCCRNFTYVLPLYLCPGGMKAEIHVLHYARKESVNTEMVVILIRYTIFAIFFLNVEMRSEESSQVVNPSRIG